VVIGIAMAGYFVRPMGWLNRLLLALSGIALLIPPGGTIAYSWAANAVGGVLALVIVFTEWRGRTVPAMT